MCSWRTGAESQPVEALDMEQSGGSQGVEIKRRNEVRCWCVWGSAGRRGDCSMLDLLG